MRESSALFGGRRKNLALNTDGPHDLLSMLLAARDEETGEGLTDQELRDEITTFIGAGNETTAGYGWPGLGICSPKHPEAARKLHAELDTVLGGRVPSAQRPASTPIHPHDY